MAEDSNEFLKAIGERWDRKRPEREVPWFPDRDRYTGGPDPKPGWRRALRNKWRALTGKRSVEAEAEHQKAQTDPTKKAFTIERERLKVTHNPTSPDRP